MNKELSDLMVAYVRLKEDYVNFRAAIECADCGKMIESAYGDALPGRSGEGVRVPGNLF